VDGGGQGYGVDVSFGGGAWRGEREGGRYGESADVVTISPL